MRKQYPSESNPEYLPITEVSIPSNTRHELGPLLLALQTLFKQESKREEILGHLASRLIVGSNTDGRPGLSLWEVLVLGVVRLCLDVDYDALEDLANHHYLIRGILGVLPKDGSLGTKVYRVGTLKRMVGRLDEPTLVAISTLVVQAGHRLEGKKNRASWWAKNQS